MFGFLHVILDLPAERRAASTDFWSAALGWPAGEPWPEHPEFRSLLPTAGDPYVHVQTGDHGPRVHLDAAVDDIDEQTSRLVALGADRGRRAAHWQTLYSPGGLPFCLLAAVPAVVPPPVQVADGHRVRLVQVCLDIPRSVVADEVEFWRVASGWRWAPSGDEAFLGKLHHDGASPVQLLLQRLGTSDRGTRTRTHLDLGTDDIEAAVRRLVNLGAIRGATGDGWVVLADPVGMTFCVTGNAPD